MRLRQLMENTKTKQQALADALEISRASVSLYVLEKREPDINTLIKMADYFGVTVDYLIGHDSPSGNAFPAMRNYVYVNDKKYELKQNALKLQINGVVVDLNISE